MAIRKITMRPPGSGNYADELHPKTSADQVISTDGNIQSDINSLKTNKSDILHNHSLANLTEKSYNSLTDKPSIPTDTAHLTKSDVYTKTEVDNVLGSAGYGDMLKSTYDNDSDGKVNSADTADSVPWSGVTGKPSTFTPSTHNHTLAQITDYTPPITIGSTQPTNGSLWFQEI